MYHVRKHGPGCGWLLLLAGCAVIICCALLFLVRRGSSTMSVSITVSDANSRASNNKKYTFISVLGQGNFGTVMKARDSSTGGLVAIKVVKAHHSLLDKILRRKSKELTDAHQEVDILEKLEHPNVLRLETYYEFNVKFKEIGLAIVTEFCSKGNLQDYLHNLSCKDERPNKELCLLWYSQLAQGLNFIHSKNIVHRDLKPPNILISSDESLKIADVGLAKAVWDLKSQSNEVPADTTFHSYMSSITGTPCYMAPEVWQKHYKPSSDIFSLGLLFAMISEAPNPLLPKGVWSNHNEPLGLLMYWYSDCRVVPPTSFMSPSLTHSDEDEIQLFDEMLQYDFHKRPNLQEIISTIKGIEEKRKQPKEEPPAATAPDSNEGSRCIIL